MLKLERRAGVAVGAGYNAADFDELLRQELAMVDSVGDPNSGEEYPIKFHGGGRFTAHPSIPRDLIDRAVRRALNRAISGISSRVAREPEEGRNP